MADQANPKSNFFIDFMMGGVSAAIAKTAVSLLEDTFRGRTTFADFV